jgi:hypothetical protein
MKVKFLKSGRWAHENQNAGQFEFKIGEIKDGISENDVKDMVNANLAEVIGSDDTDVKSAEVADTEDAKSDGDDDAKETENDSSSIGKPWSK